MSYKQLKTNMLKTFFYKKLTFYYSNLTNYIKFKYFFLLNI